MHGFGEVAVGFGSERIGWRGESLGGAVTSNRSFGDATPRQIGGELHR
jgi:hypothetical protein